MTNANKVTSDSFAAKRKEMREEFFGKLFLLGGFIGSTDTYKRTMWTAVPDIALSRAAYHLTMRKGLKEPGADNQLIMAGHEAMLAQWFFKPLLRSDIELASKWFSEKSNVRAFPHEVWNKILEQNKGDEIYLPVDIWGFAGGQTFLPGVPCLTFEGMGGAISYLEPAMCRYFAPIIQATKARLMKMVTSSDVEVGLRSAPNEIANIVLLLARYVGGGVGLTSNDNAEFLWPELFKSLGTIGHEMVCAGQSFDKTLAEAEYEMMNRFVTKMGNASLLCDLVDTETVGLENVLRVMRGHPEADGVGVRLDSGDISSQCVLYFERMKAAGLKPRIIVFENELTPETVKNVYNHFKQATGEEPTMLFPGAGGYFWHVMHRDTVSAAFKRSATADRPNVKFSNSPGKESLGGYLRVYAQGEILLVADSSEDIDGEPLFVKLVEQGRVVYNESFQSQAKRAELTWGKYKKIKLSAKIKGYKDKFTIMREKEIVQAKERLASIP